MIYPIHLMWQADRLPQFKDKDALCKMYHLLMLTNIYDHYRVAEFDVYI